MLFADQKWAHLGHASIFDLNELRWCLIAKCSSFVSGSHFLLLSRGEDSLLLPHIFNWGQHGPRGQLGHVFDDLKLGLGAVLDAHLAVERVYALNWIVFAPCAAIVHAHLVCKLWHAFRPLHSLPQLFLNVLAV